MRSLSPRERVLSLVLASLVALAMPLNAVAEQLAGSGTVEVINPSEQDITINCGTVADGGGPRYVPSGVDGGPGTLTEGQTYRWRASSAGTRIGFNRGFAAGVDLSESPESFALASEPMGGTTIGLAASRDGGFSEIVCTAPSGTASVYVKAVRAGRGK